MSRNPSKPKSSDRPALRWAMIIVGWAIIIGAPIIGIFPGPGGLILFPIGLGIVLKNSRWAKRRFAIHAKRHPEYGKWINWALRRKRFKERPPFPPLRQDLLHIFRRDDILAADNNGENPR